MRTKVPSVGRALSLPWIRDEVDRYRDYLRAEKRSESTIRQYGETLEGFLQWFERPTKELSKADLQRWKGHLAMDLKYCENTMSTKIAAVNQYAERILERPDIKIRPPGLVFRTRIPLTKDEVQRILDEARKPHKGRQGFRNNSDTSLRDYAAICLMYYGGLRVNEVATLRLTDLDLEDKKVRVHQGKRMDFSLVNLNDVAVNAIRDYLEHGRPKPTIPENADYLFISIRGLPMGRGKLCPIVKKIAFRAGIEKNVHPHIFRHSMITHMAEEGLPAQMIQAQSRHKSLDMVQRYTHLSQQSVRLAYDKVFSKQEPTAREIIAQKPSVQPEKRKSDSSELKERILEAFLDGKISEDKIGRLEKLLSMLDGHPAKAVNIEGYA